MFSGLNKGFVLREAREVPPFRFRSAIFLNFLKLINFKEFSLEFASSEGMKVLKMLTKFLRSNSESIFSSFRIKVGGVISKRERL